MARGSRSTNRHTPSAPTRDTTLPNPGQAGIQVPQVPILASQVIRPGDARINIEVNKYKYTDIDLEPGQMENLTGEQIAEAIRLYNQTRNKDQDQCENSHHPERSHRSRSVFDRIGDKEKDPEKRLHRTHSRNHDEEAEKLKKLAELREKIQAEEQARLDLRVQKRLREEEVRILGKATERRRPWAPSPEIISDEDEPREDLIDMIHELQRKVGKDSGLDIGDTLTPFSYSLEATPRQKNIKHYNFESFNGLDDPEEHVNYFEQIAMIYYYNDLTKCRFFASTLKSGAQRWFSRIPSRSIHSWKQFRDAFLKCFRANKTHEMHMCHLETVRQTRGEPLSAYMKRFQEAINNITNMDEQEALTIFRRNLDPDNNEMYVLDLIHKEPQSLAAAYAMAARFIKETDVLQAMRMTRQGISPTRIQDSPKSNYNHQDKKFKPNRESNYIQSSQLALPSPPPDSNQRRKPEPRPELNRTPLNRARADILKEVRDKPFYYPPKPMVTAPENRSIHRHCDYHETHGHTTESCLSLKFFVEDQIKKGNMGQYIARRASDRGEGSGKDKNVMNVVMGGSNSPPRSSEPGDEVMLIQTYPDQVISFSKEDFEGLNPNHNEALVVSLDIADNDVQRVLIDNGSSVNILFKHTMDRMQLGSVKMNDCREDHLYGFRNNLVPIQGTLYLPVLFGSFPKQVTNMVKFYIINTPSSYNVILGRPALTKLQAITSTPHLKFKFPTPCGIGEVRGDYEMASRCYGQALVMAETDPENKRKATSYQKNISRKKLKGI